MLLSNRKGHKIQAINDGWFWKGLNGRNFPIKVANNDLASTKLLIIIMQYVGCGWVWTKPKKYIYHIFVCMLSSEKRKKVT